MNAKRVTRGLLSLALVFCMVTGIFAIPVQAEEQTTFHYVSMGASNTNGYGIRGYITEEELALVLSGQASKDDINVYGYQRTPEGAYPDLIRDHYVEIYGEGNVFVDQLAISSMRVEELRILLDDSYMGDDYSAWRFTGADGWFRSAEEGGIDALRLAYQESVENADLITVDIGWNNFGVYVCNQLVQYMSNGSYKWTTDINTIFDTEAEQAAAAEAKAIIAGYIQQNVGEGELSTALTDIFSYSILGYIHNFDIVMEKIYELNPDADVVVIGIQNLLHGVELKMDGDHFPLGAIFGNFVNMANYYISACSPWQSRYQYIKAGADEHVSIFLDYMKSYDGNAGALNQNVKDCFDYYDNDLFIQTRIDYVAAAMIESEYGDLLPLLGYSNGAEAVADGKKGVLPTVFGVNVQELFDEMYWPALNAAYDTLAVLVKEIANTEEVDADGLLGGTIDINAVEEELITALEDEIAENAIAAANGEAYTVEIPGILPEKEADTMVVAAMYIRYYMGNSFFAHPDEIGHEEIADAVFQILNNPDSEQDQALADYLADSVVGIHQLLCGATGHNYEDGICTDCNAQDPDYVKTVATGWSGDTQWTLTEDGLLYIYGNGNMKNYGWGGNQPWLNKGVEITSVVVEKGVAAIGTGAFKDLTTLESVTLPETGLKTIGEAAFYGCTSLKEIYIPDGVYTIWEYVFKNCTALENVRLPRTLIKIDQGAFENCSALPYVFFPGELETIRGWSFKACTSLTEIDMTWVDATEIQAGAFKNCEVLTNIILPANIQVLGDSCFYGIGATTFTVPETVTSIEAWCFARSAVTEIIFEGDAPAIGEGAFNKITATASYPDGNTTWTAENMQNYGGTVTWIAN